MKRPSAPITWDNVDVVGSKCEEWIDYADYLEDILRGLRFHVEIMKEGLDKSLGPPKYDVSELRKFK